MRRILIGSALVLVAFAALMGGTSRDAYASPGCDAMNIPWQSVDFLSRLGTQQSTTAHIE